MGAPGEMFGHKRWIKSVYDYAQAFKVFAIKWIGAAKRQAYTVYG